MDNQKTQEPYKHDCEKCKWVGWLCNFPLGKNDLANVYLCGDTVVIRYGNEPHEYWSKSASECRKGGIIL